MLIFLPYPPHCISTIPATYPTTSSSSPQNLLFQSQNYFTGLLQLQHPIPTLNSFYCYHQIPIQNHCPLAFTKSFLHLYGLILLFHFQHNRAFYYCPQHTHIFSYYKPPSPTDSITCTTSITANLFYYLHYLPALHFTFSNTIPFNLLNRNILLLFLQSPSVHRLILLFHFLHIRPSYY